MKTKKQFERRMINNEKKRLRLANECIEIKKKGGKNADKKVAKRMQQIRTLLELNKLIDWALTPNKKRSVEKFNKKHLITKKKKKK